MNIENIWHSRSYLLIAVIKINIFNMFGITTMKVQFYTTKIILIAHIINID